MMRFGKSTILSNFSRKYIIKKPPCFDEAGPGGNRAVFKRLSLSNLLKCFNNNGCSCPDKHPPLVRGGGGDRGAENGSWRMRVLYYFTDVINQNINSKCYCKGGRGKPG